MGVYLLELLSCTHNAGCAAKMSAKDLSSIVGVDTTTQKEDAFYFNFDSTHTVHSLDIISPIIDNPYYYGQIAVAHVLSDIYAMGATPATALNICCFPVVNQVNKQDLADILLGAKVKLNEVSCVCLGGHTVVDDNIKYGLSVTGTVSRPDLLTRNCNLQVGDSLILTKPIGIGLLVSLLKLEYDKTIEQTIIDSCTQINSIGKEVTAYGVRSMTDVTGFGLVGHLLEMAKASNVSISLCYDAIPVFPIIDDYIIDINKGVRRIQENYAFCSPFLDPEKLFTKQKSVLFDPQTSGGLVLAINNENKSSLLEFLKLRNISYSEIGTVTSLKNYIIDIK